MYFVLAATIVLFAEKRINFVWQNDEKVGLNLRFSSNGKTGTTSGNLKEIGVKDAQAA